MSIYKRGRVYWFNFVYNGKRYQQSTKLRNPKDARDRESAIRTALAKGEVGIVERKPVPQFKQAMADFLKWHETEHANKPSTSERHRFSSLALLKHFRDTSLDRIGAAEVEAFKTARLSQFRTRRAKEGRKLTSKPIKPATVNREIACLRALFNYYIRSGVALTNPIGRTGVKSYREDNEHTRVLTYEEEAKYLAKATPMLADVAVLILETGMRPEEVCHIEAANVNLSESYLYIPLGKTKAAKRRIKLTARAKEVLTRRMKECERARRMKESEGRYIFTHASDPNRPVPGVKGAHLRAVRNSNIAPFRLYDCRHTFATRAIQAGVDLVTLAAVLGHSKINMVMRYAHPTQKHQTEAIAKIEEYNTRQLIALAEKNSPVVSRAVQ